MMTPTPNDTILLEELNKLIAEQKGVSVDDLAINDGSQQPKKTAAKKDDPTRTTSASVNEDGAITDVKAIENLTPTQMRSRADKLFKEAQSLRKQADEVDPPKSKKKSVAVEA